MPEAPPFDLPGLVQSALAIACTHVSYWKDRALPWIGGKTELSIIWFILPRLVPALILTGMLQVMTLLEAAARHFVHGPGLKAILIAAGAGVLTPDRPMVSVPFLVVLATSGIALGPLVADMTSWALFGLRRSSRGRRPSWAGAPC